MTTQTRLHRSLPEWVAILICVFIVLFPKGGFKVGDVPITWGYLLIGAAFVAAVPQFLLQISKQRLNSATLTLLGCLLPFLCLLIISLIFNGTDDLGGVISDVVCFAILPFAFLVLFPTHVEKMNVSSLANLLRWLIFGAAAYGIFLFVWRLVMGSFIEIPFLTVNLGDVGQLETGKNIDRGGIFKLISTYNNGNVYGVATLILLPLYDHLEQSKWRKAIMRVALILTLSRTVWIGVVLNQVLSLVPRLKKDFQNFPKVRVKGFSLGLVLLVASGLLLAGGLWVLSSGMDFIFDPSMGGRADQIEALRRASFLPSVPVSAFSEIVYAASVSIFGWVGGLATVLMLTSPILAYVTRFHARFGEGRLAAFQGLVLYVFLAAMDGAINLIPIMAFYWLACMLFVNDRLMDAVDGRAKPAIS